MEDINVHLEGLKKGIYAYSLGCRCDTCRQWKSFQLERRKRELGTTKSARTPTHGKVYLYNVGCRCELCKDAARTRRQNDKVRLAKTFAKVNREADIKWAFALWERNQAEAIQNPKFRKMLEDGILRL